MLIPKSSDVDNDAVQENTVRKALGLGRADEIMARRYGIVLRHQDTWTLNACGWLNDQIHTCIAHESCLSLIIIQVINYYMGLLMERFDDVFACIQHLPLYKLVK